MKQSTTSPAPGNGDVEALREKLAMAEAQCQHALQEKESTSRFIEEIHQDWLRAFDAVPDPIFMHDRELRITRANKAYAARAGLKFRQFIGQPYWEVFPRRAGPFPGCVEAMAAPEPGHLHEEEFQLETGEWYRSRASHAFDGNGAYQYSIHILQDITSQKKSIIALAESEEKFRQICGSAQDAILMMDNDGCVSYWNPAAEKILGYTFAEVQGKDMHQLLAPEGFHAAYTAGFAHFRETGEGAAIGKTLELVARRKGGAEFPIELSVAAVNMEGKWGAIGIMRDISSRKAAEHALQESEQRFRTVVETVPDVLYQNALPGNVTTYVSPSIRHLLGYAPDEFLANQHLWLGLLHDGDRERVLKETESAIKRKAKQLHQEYRVWHKNRQDVLWLQNRVTILYDESGRAVGLVGALSDITELKRSQADLQKISRIQKTLSFCNSALVHAMEEPALLQSMTNIIVEIGGYQGAWVGYALHDKARTLQPMAQSGIPAGYIEALNPTWSTSGFGAGPTSKAIRTGKRQIVQHVQELDNRSGAEWYAALIGLGTASCIAIPLVVEGKVLGNLTILSGEPDAFDVQAVGLLQELADDLAFGIMTLRARVDRRKNLEELQRHQDQVRKTLESTIQAIAATVEMRDPYTAGHERRVAELAAAIAREMGLPESRVEGVRVAGTIHDLGKIQVPAEILSKPRDLSDIEFSLIKTHPLMGYNILKDIDFPWPVAQMVLQHHERLDGSGYPSGLKGKQILLESRILAVADTVEAMASHRPYRAGLGVQAALDEISAGSGKLYDPDVVDACVRLFRTRGYSLVE